MSGKRVNWPLAAAGVLMIVAAVVHGVLGDAVLRTIGRLEMPPNPFGGPVDTGTVLRITWHFGTIAWGFLGAWLLATGVRPHADFADGVTYLSATLLSCYALIALVSTLYKRGPAGLVKHPGPVVLSTAALLAWWGSTSL